MPDGSTAYQYFERLTNGLSSKVVEKWASGDNALFRTNTFTFAANNVDLTLHVGPDGGQLIGLHHRFDGLPVQEGLHGRGARPARHRERQHERQRRDAPGVDSRR